MSPQRPAPAGPPARGRTRAWRSRPAVAAAAALGVDLALAALLCVGAWRAPGRAYVGTGGDPIQAMWSLGWTPWALLHGHDPLLTDHLAAPGGANLMWNTPMTLPGLLLWPVTAGLGPTVAYNVLATANLGISAWTAQLVIGRLVAGRLAAFAGGLVYGFSPYMVAQSLGHANLTCAVLPPCMLALVALVATGRARHPVRAGALLGGLAAGQVLIDEELLASTALVAALLLAALAVCHRARVRARLRAASPALAAALLGFAVLAAVPLAVQFAGPHRVGGLLVPRNRYLTDLLGPVLPTRAQLLAPDAAFRVSDSFSGNNPSESTAYLGAPLLLLLGLLWVRRRRDPRVAVVGAAGLATLVLSLGATLHVAGHDLRVPLPEAAIGAVPVLQNLLADRLMLFVFLAAGVLVAVWLERPGTAARPGRGPALRWLAAAAALAALVPRLPLPTGEATTPGFFTSAAANRLGDPVALVLPYPTAGAEVAMLWQAQAGFGFRMAGGYIRVPGPHGELTDGGPVPVPAYAALLVEYGSAVPTDRPDVDARIRAGLRDAGIDLVVIGPMAHHDAEVALFSRVLGVPAQTAGGTDVFAGVVQDIAAAPTPR